MQAAHPSNTHTHTHLMLRMHDSRHWLGNLSPSGQSWRCLHMYSSITKPRSSGSMSPSSCGCGCGGDTAYSTVQHTAQGHTVSNAPQQEKEGEAKQEDVTETGTSSTLDCVVAPPLSESVCLVPSVSISAETRPHPPTFPPHLQHIAVDVHSHVGEVARCLQQLARQATASNQRSPGTSSTHATCHSTAQHSTGVLVNMWPRQSPTNERTHARAHAWHAACPALP